ncbi:hypothetical protein COCHEDRAFT_1027716 [Bipolaris maydis C5]|uniref:Heterokaryon incompatibility domain-containing protein n=1 Tax=Cochliobolus heterostrophus (strain C5 / ATCC 48332 / race O) TaxID=701091 RepID=M2V5K8_COCH5|nr:hypothetical protein COCHEDRAFT_1027716 [Bipolaris maydis C5]KAJ6214256.1 hypothetical protein PSV09DRAFT_1027716 [Bipolaris maydis]
MDLGILIENLLQTYQEAVIVGKELGIHYLWIDSLCIVQDSEQDWSQQASRMADVYQNSFLTIAAIAARDSGGGLFNDISNRQISHPMLKYPWLHVQRQIRSPSPTEKFMDMQSDDGFLSYKRG